MFVSINKDLLESIRISLMEAIASEDGLDGNEGMTLIEAVNLALGRDENDHTVNEVEATEVAEEWKEIHLRNKERWELLKT